MANPKSNATASQRRSKAPSRAATTSPLFQTIAKDAGDLRIPRFQPEIALILHRHTDQHGYSSRRSVMASLHAIKREKDKGWFLAPGRILDRTEELVIADNLANAEPAENKKLVLYPPGLLHTDAASATWYLPPECAPMVFRTEKGLVSAVVPWPAMVCHAQGPEFFVVALSDSTPPTLDMPVFHAPLGNVYQNSGLCLGNIAPPRGHALQAIHEWTRILRATPFTGTNHDHAIAKRQGDKLVEFWTALEGKTALPANVLVKRNQTLGAWLHERLDINDEPIEVDDL